MDERWENNGRIVPFGDGIVLDLDPPITMEKAGTIWIAVDVSGFNHSSRIAAIEYDDGEIVMYRANEEDSY